MMKKLCLVALTAAVLIQSAAPARSDITWGVTSTMSFARYAMNAARVGNRIYLIGDPYTLHIYDINANTWSTGNAVPDTQYGPVVGLGGKLYVIGGVTGASGNPRATGQVQVYDPATNSWSKAASLPKPHAAGGAAVLNGKIHLVGGSAYVGAVLQDVTDHLVYDPAANAWTSLAPVPTARQAMALVADPDTNTLYAIGGYHTDSMNTSNDNEVYDAASNAWTKKAHMQNGVFNAGSAYLNGKIYIFGGSTRHEMFATVQEYDVTGNAWSRRGALPAVRPKASAATVTGKIYVTGGSVCQASTCIGTDRLWVYSPRPTGAK